MQLTRSILLTSLVLAAGVAQAEPVTSASAVQAKLKAAGYTQVHELERDDGLWEADVTRPDGRFAEVRVDPATGEIFDARDGRPVLDSAAILTHAQRHGLKDIHKLKRDGALWEVEARDAAGRPVKARLSGIDGRLVHSERERWWD